MDKEKALSDLGDRLRSQFLAYETDRRPKEIEWLKSLRQFKGIYEHDVIIPKGRSRAYPRVTRAKAVAARSRLMEMLFPSTEKNWGITASPVPDLSTAALQQVIQAVLSRNPKATPEDVEQAVRVFAAQRAAEMSREIADQLDEQGYKDLVRDTLWSGILYGTGVLKGPFVKSAVRRTWVQDPTTGQFTAEKGVVKRPHFEFLPIWSFYPDLSAKTWEQCDGYFVRHVMSRHEVRELMKRPDFMADQIQTYLGEHQEGNYAYKYFETELRAMGSEIMPSQAKNKFEVLEYWGFVSGQTLQAIGMEIPEDQLGLDVEVSVWTVDSTVIKAVVNPYDAGIRPFHLFTFEQDDSSLLGTGLPEILRDSQRAICASARMVLDNGSAVAGPMVEVNVDLLAPSSESTETEIHPFKVYEREGIGAEAAVPAVRDITVNSHITELLSILSLFKTFADEESTIRDIGVGDASVGAEALRTSGGISMLMGASNVSLRDTVRNFDRFTESVIGALVKWNNQFNEREEIKGDHMPLARGSTSLVAKEMRAQALDALAQTLTNEERGMLRIKELLRQRLAVHDLSVDTLLKSDDETDQLDTANQQLAQMQQQLQFAQMEAKVKNLLAQAFLAIAKGTATGTQSQAAVIEQIMNSLEGDLHGNTGGASGTQPQLAGPAGGLDFGANAAAAQTAGT